MIIAGPGEAVTLSVDGIPTGEVVGYQVMKAATGTVAVGRTTVGVVERPSGSGNYVATFAAPVEADLYLIVLDWNGGVITTTKSRVEEMQVASATAQAETGLGLIADYVKTFIGGETFDLLVGSPSYGSAYVSIAIETVKARVMEDPLLTSQEGTLPVVVLSWLGKLAALQLLPAAADAWSTRAQSRSVGSDPTEIVTYPSREAMLKLLADRLLADARAEEALALSLIPSARLLSTSSGPAIDEDAGQHVTRDPRLFPREQCYPFGRGGALSPVAVASSPSTSDPYGP